MTKPNWIDVHFPLYGRPRATEEEAKGVGMRWKCQLCGERVGHGFHECTPKPEDPT